MNREFPDKVLASPCFLHIMKTTLHIFVLEMMPMQTGSIWKILSDIRKTALLRRNVSFELFEKIPTGNRSMIP